MYNQNNSYHSLLNQLDDIVSAHEKRAMEHYDDHAALDGDANKLDPQGHTAPAGPKETDQHSPDQKSKSLDKSVQYQINPNSKDEKVTKTDEVYEKMKNQKADIGYSGSSYGKSATDANSILGKIHSMLNNTKYAEEDMKEKVEEVADAIASECPEEDEVTLTKEEEEYADKNNMDKEAFLRDKKAGFWWCKVAHENPVARQMMDQMTMMKAGQVLAILEQQGLLMSKKAADQYAGGLLHTLEKKGSIRRTDEPSLSDRYVMLKAAAKKAAEEVISDINSRTNIDNIQQILGYRGN